MKKTGLFKIIMITLVAMVISSLLISSSYFEDGKLAELGMNYTGVFDAFGMFFKSFLIEYFVQTVLLVLSIGALYGVLESTDAYKKLVNKIVKDLKGREFLFIVLVSLFIAVITSVFDYGFALFIFFPFIISILLAMGYDKVTVGVSTFGATLIGIIGSTIGYNTTGVITKVLQVNTNSYFYFKLALLLIGYVVLLLYLFKAERHKLTKDELEELNLTVKNQDVKYKGVVIVLVLLFVLLVLGCTSWTDTFKVNVFTKFHESITEISPKLPFIHITSEGVKVGTEEFTLVKSIIGNVAEFGKWYYSEMTVICFLASLVLGLIYHVDIFKEILNGIKKTLKPAGMLFLSYLVLYLAANIMNYPTIAGLLLKLTSKFSVIISSIVMAIASFFHVDALFVANYAAPQVAIKTSNTALVALLTQSIYGVTMFIAPTSIYLTYGLTLLGIPYKEWVKKTWKLVAVLYAIVIIVLLIAKVL